jgi:hypothetical protein
MLGVTECMRSKMQKNVGLRYPPIRASIGLYTLVYICDDGLD